MKRMLKIQETGEYHSTKRNKNGGEKKKEKWQDRKREGQKKNKKQRKRERE